MVFAAWFDDDQNIPLTSVLVGSLLHNTQRFYCFIYSYVLCFIHFLVSIPPPDNVKVKVIDQGRVLVTWEPSKKNSLTGYEVRSNIQFKLLFLC